MVKVTAEYIPKECVISNRRIILEVVADEVAPVKRNLTLSPRFGVIERLDERQDAQDDWFRYN